MAFHKSARNDVEHPAGQSATNALSLMTLLDAIEIVESDEGANDPIKHQAAWQYIYESGAYRSLQGWYGRNVAAMLESGYIDR